MKDRIEKYVVAALPACLDKYLKDSAGKYETASVDQKLQWAAHYAIRAGMALDEEFEKFEAHGFGGKCKTLMQGNLAPAETQDPVDVGGAKVYKGPLSE